VERPLGQRGQRELVRVRLRRGEGFLTEDTEGYRDEQGYATLEELMRAVYAHGDQWRHDSGPVARPSSGDVFDLFSFNV
jgi:hypothetical protein